MAKDSKQSRQRQQHEVDSNAPVQRVAQVRSR